MIFINNILYFNHKNGSYEKDLLHIESETN